MSGGITTGGGGDGGLTEEEVETIAEEAAAAAVAAAASPSNGLTLFDDFVEVNTAEDVFGRYKGIVTGDGTVTKAPRSTDLPQHPGIVRVEVGAGDSKAHLHMAGGTPDQRSFVFGNGNTLMWEGLVKISQVTLGLWAAGTCSFGFSDSSNPWDNGSYIAIFFLEPNAENWGMWTYGGTGSDIYTYSSQPFVNGWHKLKIEGNTAGTSVTYSINGVVVGTHTTGIPTAPATEAMGVVAASIVSNLLPTEIDVDYSRVSLTLGTPR